MYASVEHLRDLFPFDASQFEAKLEQYLSIQLAPKRLGFFRVVNRHRELIESLLTAHPRPGALRYAYLHGHPPSQLSPALIGDPATDAMAAPIGDQTVWVLSIVEAIEADYRRVRDLGDKSAAKATLDARLQTFDLLISSQRLTAEERVIVRHHRGKSLLKLGRVDEALKVFESIVAEGCEQYATKLQIARLSSTEPLRAKALIFEIIEAEYSCPGSVATSVLLETLSTLRRRHLRQFVAEMTEKYGPFMAQQIKAAACSGEDLPIKAFAAVGAEWWYKAPSLFLEVLEAIDLGSPKDAEDDDERVAIGRLLTAAGKVLSRQGQVVEARERFREAIAFFAGIVRRSAFARTQYADALLRLDRAREAAQILDETPLGEREAFWLLRRSEAHFVLGEYSQSLAHIDKALNGPDLGERRSTFLAQRAYVLFAMNDGSYEDVLREAIQICGDPQYCNDLERKLEQMRVDSTTSAEAPRDLP